MDAVKFIVKQALMCNSNIEGIIGCESCGLNNSEYCIKLCDGLISRAGAEEAVRIVEAWAEAHPAKTRQDALLKYVQLALMLIIAVNLLMNVATFCETVWIAVKNTG